MEYYDLDLEMDRDDTKDFFGDKTKAQYLTVKKLKKTTLMY